MSADGIVGTYLLDLGRFHIALGTGDSPMLNFYHWFTLLSTFLQAFHLMDILQSIHPPVEENLDYFKSWQ
jgi:hypothetical protein